MGSEKIKTQEAEIPEIVAKFLKDAEISVDLKSYCYRLAQNKNILHLLRKTQVSTLFWICEEYKKNPDIYDDIFSGKIKVYIKGSDTKAQALFYSCYAECESLGEIFSQSHIIRQVADKFSNCKSNANNIRRITIKANNDKIITVGFNCEKEVVSMLVDYINIKNKSSKFLEGLISTNEKRMDFIRI